MKQREREKAEVLYVEGQKTVEEIAEQLAVSDKSVRNWKDKGGWEQKREAYLKRKTKSVEAFEQLIEDLTAEIAADRKKGRRPSVSRLNTLAGLQKRLDALRGQAKRDTENLAEAEEEKKPALSPENYLKIERELFGLHADAYRN